MFSGELIAQLLSTCERCRRLRRKCDTQLPNCRICQKAGLECTLYDHALQQSLPRAYVQALLNRVEELTADKPDNQSSQGRMSHDTVHERSVAAGAQTSNNLFDGTSIRPLQEHNSLDRHFLVPSAPGRSRFFGSSSVFALSVEVLHYVSKVGIVPAKDLISPPEAAIRPVSAGGDDLALSFRDYLRPETIKSLFDLFFASINVLYDILDESNSDADLQRYSALRDQKWQIEQVLSPADAHSFFRASMICAIAAATQARYHSSRGEAAKAFYYEAVALMQQVTSEVSLASLQALLLMIVFCLFLPRHGDIWKLLDYACRLSVELGYHVEPALGTETQAQQKTRRSTFWGLYAIERIVGQLFGRASDLPEPIITTEYPSSVSTTPGTADPTALPSIAAAHHYRHTFLRSEIFRDLYLPASTVSFNMDWYLEHFRTLQTWRNDLPDPEELVSLATLECDISHHSTICFLFQPLMMHALREAADVEPGKGLTLHIPQDNYWASCVLIKTYERVFLAPEQSTLGKYPATFIVAHDILQAGMTLMAHALLALGGQIATYQPFLDVLPDVDEDSLTAAPLDFANFIEVSNACLVLLSSCAERWPGLEGILHVYRRIASAVTPALVRKGLIS